MNIMCQQSGVSDVEAFIDSYLELLNSGMSHEDVERNCQWVEKNPYFDPENPYNCEEYNTVFVIEDVEELLKDELVMSPVSIYDHSGVSIWLGSPTCMWIAAR